MNEQRGISLSTKRFYQICLGCGAIGGVVVALLGLFALIFWSPAINIPEQVVVMQPVIVQPGQSIADAIQDQGEVEAEAETNILATIILIGSLLLLVVGIAVLTIRLSRR